MASSSGWSNSFAWASFHRARHLQLPLLHGLVQEAKETLLTSYQNSALLIGKKSQSQVFQNFVALLSNRFGAIKLSDSNQYSPYGFRW